MISRLCRFAVKNANSHNFRFLCLNSLCLKSLLTLPIISSVECVMTSGSSYWASDLHTELGISFFRKLIFTIDNAKSASLSPSHYKCGLSEKPNPIFFTLLSFGQNCRAHDSTDSAYAGYGLSGIVSVVAGIISASLGVFCGSSALGVGGIKSTGLCLGGASN